VAQGNQSPAYKHSAEVRFCDLIKLCRAENWLKYSQGLSGFFFPYQGWWSGPSAYMTCINSGYVLTKHVTVSSWWHQLNTKKWDTGESWMLEVRESGSWRCRSLKFVLKFHSFYKCLT
jgi:hypothetical protein